jgi:hypothetical protein
MKKRVVTGLVLVVVLLLAAASQASAGADRIEVSSYEYDCFTGFAEGGGVWGDEEGVTHVRSILHSNPNVSDTPELDGMHHTVADGEFNGVTGNASIRGSSVWEPEGIDGTWVGHWTVLYNKNHGSGHGTFRGTGALQGKMLIVDVYDAVPDGKLAEMCAGIGEPEGYALTVGYILEVPAP